MQILKDVQAFRLGQTLDEVKSNGQILSGIAKVSKRVQAIVVKFIIMNAIAGPIAPESIKTAMK